MKRFFSSAVSGGTSSKSIAPFTVFQPTGMMMAKPVPLTVATIDDSTTIAREGYVAMTLLPRSTDPTKTQTSFDKDKRLTVKLRAKQIGEIISWKLAPPGSRTQALQALVFQAYSSAGSQVNVELKPLPVNPQEDDQFIQLTVTNRKTPTETETTTTSTMMISIPIPAGEVKAFQVLLEAALPHLYGWVPKLAGRVGPSYSSSSSSSSKSPEDFFKQFK